MASESGGEGVVQVDLAPELDEWLRDRATAMQVDPGTVLAQLVASYQAASELDGDSGDLDGLAIQVSDERDVERLVEAAVADRLADEGALESRLEAVVDERLDAAESGLEERLDAVNSDFRAKLEDVRERVVQVKREADAKAPADHDHDALEERLCHIEADLADLESTLESLGETVAEAPGAELEAAVADLESSLEEFEERLTTVAWVVSDLREAVESPGSDATLDDLTRSAAAADISRAKCENCGEGVELGLLTEPACPHCEATVTTVEAASGLFGKPKLLVASQLESGEG